MNYIAKKIRVLLFIAIFGLLSFGGIQTTQIVYAQADNSCNVTADCNTGSSCIDNKCIVDAFGTADVQASANLGSQDIRLTIARVIRTILGLLGIIAVVIVLYGGFTYMTAGGSEDKVATAKKIIINGVIGLGIIMSAYAITQFVFNSLSKATGSGNTGGITNTIVDNSGCDSGASFCFGSGGGKNGGNSCIEKNDLFVLKAITPNQENININNIVIRAIFSEPVLTKPEDILTITHGGTLVSKDEFNYKFLENSNKQVVVVTKKINTICNTDGVSPVGCYENSNLIYGVKVNKEVTSVSGKTLENDKAEQSCGDGFGQITSEGAVFEVSARNYDKKTPEVEAKISSIVGESSEDAISIPVGESFTLSYKVNDQNGVGLAHVKLDNSEVSNEPLFEFFSANKEDTNEEHQNEIEIGVGADVTPGVYNLAIEAVDIDSNVFIYNKEVTVVKPVVEGDDIIDNKKDGGEGDSCSTTSQCSANLKCIETTCQKSPKILGVSPMNGAEGNWVTISGVYFGQNRGVVEFGIAEGGNTNQINWIPADIISCDNNTQWKDSFITVAVPNDDEFKQNELAAIRVTTKDNKKDATNDSYGPKPVSISQSGKRLLDGYFQKNEVVRPQLCSVKTNKGAVSGLPGEAISAVGQGFGEQAGSVLFGGYSGQNIEWKSDEVSASIPGNILQGTISVAVKAKDSSGKDVLSNAVPFTITTSQDNKDISITSISPTETSPKSYITISGSGFGVQKGKMFLSKSSATSCPGDGCILLLEPDAACTQTWSDKQVIAQIPAKNVIDINSSYFVHVVAYPGAETSKKGVSNEAINITDQEPLPSICSLTPAQGPAPSPTGHKLTLNGANFSNSPTVYFSTKNSDQKDVTKNWLKVSKLTKNSDSQLLITQANDSQITTSIPVGTEGVNAGISMQTGPIRVAAKNGKLSNPVTYEVADCRDSSSAIIDTMSKQGLHCCLLEGPDVGLWKPENYSCAGETRAAGYVWRFSSGQLPNIPSVIEDQTCSVATPASPSPWKNHVGGENTCYSADVAVRLSTTINKDTVTTNNIKIRNCGLSEETCDEGNFEVFDSKAIAVLTGKEGSIIKVTPKQFKPNTWYRVELAGGTSGINSKQTITLAGKSQTVNIPLKATAPCNNNKAAYCYTFKTSNEACTVEDVKIIPNDYTVSNPGVIQVPGSKSLEGNPLYYNVVGLTKNACTSVNVDGLGWKWFTNGTNVSVKVAPDFKKGIYDSRAKVTVNQVFEESELVGVTTDSRFVITVDKNDTDRYNKTQKLKDNLVGSLYSTSTINFDSSKPKAENFAPTCGESCTNAQILVRFTKIMDESSYAAGLHVYECTDGAICNEKDQVTYAGYIIDSEQSSPYDLVASLKQGNKLKPNTYYKVKLSGIKSIASVNKDTKQVVYGLPLEPVTWQFKTQNNPTPCKVSQVVLEPKEFIGTFIGQQKLYVAKAKTAPNSCNSQGQAINSLDYSYDWKSSDSKVAEVTSFPGVKASKLNQSCGVSCILEGSDILNTAVSETYLCGNGIVDPGEDCDIAIAGEVVGTSCSLSCLRPGNSKTSCGDGIVNNLLGEQCDTADDETKAFCSSDCRLTGSGSFDPVNPGPVCGDAKVDQGEACDIGITDGSVKSQTGCSDSCLQKGTVLAKSWCETQKVKPAACTQALSVCGNGKIEPGESCEVTKEGLFVKGFSGVFISGDTVANYCSSACVLQNACDLESSFKAKSPNQQISAGALWCDPKTEGCSAQCTPLGASLTYSVPSICGDNKVGFGEILSCEADAKSTNTGSGPVQLVTLKGVLETKDPIQKATISVVLGPDKEKLKDSGDVSLQCGYQEYTNSVITDGRSNDCPNSAHGVSGVNSCCYPRPTRTKDSESPKNLAGLDGVTTPACRNTAIEFSSESILDINTINKNTVLLVEGFSDKNAKCSDVSLNKTNIVSQALALHSNREDEVNNIFVKAFNSVKSFVLDLFGREVDAGEFPKSVNDVKTWCVVSTPYDVSATYTYNPDTKTTSTIVSVDIEEALSANSVFATVLVGGNSGITNSSGVGFTDLDNTNDTHNDMWAFKTQQELCKIDSVNIKPDGYLFVKTNQKQEFVAKAITSDNKKIVSTKSYSWDWNWGPQDNPVFTISKGKTAKADISSKEVQGEVLGVGQAVITADSSAINNHKNKTFAATTKLVASFCNNPWPKYQSDNSWKPYSDNDLAKYNIQLQYCADANIEATQVDDLPYLKPAVPLEAGQSDDKDVLLRKIFLNNKNNDAIGLQIFKNNNRLSAAQWYADKFPGAKALQDTNVGGFDAISDGSRYFINALNIEKTTGNVYNNIYLFTLNANSQTETQEVFIKLMEKLEFNTNLSNYNYCLKTGVTPKDALPKKASDLAKISNVSCQNDFDCRQSNGSPKSGTNGVCSNEKTKFIRDWKRLQDVKLVQDNLVNHKSIAGVYPDFAGGSFIPNYTVSKWTTSWGALSAKIGGAPVDPLNRWTACSTDDQESCWNVKDSKFSCPAFSSVYEYQYVTSTKDYDIHVPFEYFDVKDNAFINTIGKEFVTDISKLKSDQLCKPGQQYSPFGQSCGDGVVQPGEDCDPKGSEFIEQCVGADSGKYKIWTCSDSCTWDKSAQCTTGGTCGNGVVEAGETCDDGELNGTYGHCNNTCSAPSGDYCGNGKIDKDAKGNALETCDPTVTGADGWSSYALNKDKSCGFSCQGPGGYCGDGLVNGAETCDDGNNIIGDGCSNSCQIENIACLQQQPQYHVVGEEGKTKTSYIYANRQTENNILILEESLFAKNINSKSLKTYQTNNPIVQCVQNTTGKQICAGAGLTCSNVYFGDVIQGIESKTYVSIDSDPQEACINKLDEYNVSSPGKALIIECSGVYKPLSEEQLVEGKLGCGNGKVEVGEVCDQGVSNGLACDPAYGNSCTYCSADCKNVLAKEPDSYCGDKKVDVSGGEQCDYAGLINSQTRVFTSTSPYTYVNNNSLGITCADKSGTNKSWEGKYWRGSIQCAAQCKQVEDASCVLCGLKTGGATPRVSIINPLVAGKFDGSKYFPDQKQETLKLFRYGDVSYDPSKVGTLGVLPFAKYDDLTKSSPFTFDKGGDIGIQTNGMCSDAYKGIFFVGKLKSDEEESYLGTVGKQKADSFDFPVSNQTGSVSSEIIMSPAVPKYQIRAVVKWTDKKSPNLIFRGAYHNGTKLVQESSLKNNEICVDMKLTNQVNNSWVPDCNKTKDNIFVHKQANGEITHVQAFTFDTKGISANQVDTAFVVQSLNGPIAQYINSDVQVEIYTYHANQNSKYSIYKPTQTFTIKQSEGTSSNALAKYWHVFNVKRTKNLENDKYITITPVNSLESTENGIRENVPSFSVPSN